MQVLIDFGWHEHVVVQDESLLALQHTDLAQRVSVQLIKDDLEQHHECFVVVQGQVMVFELD